VAYPNYRRAVQNNLLYRTGNPCSAWVLLSAPQQPTSYSHVPMATTCLPYDVTGWFRVLSMQLFVCVRSSSIITGRTRVFLLSVRLHVWVCVRTCKCIRDNDTVNSFETSQRLGLHVVVLFTATHTHLGRCHRQLLPIGTVRKRCGNYWSVRISVNSSDKLSRRFHMHESI